MTIADEPLSSCERDGLRRYHTDSATALSRTRGAHYRAPGLGSQSARRRESRMQVVAGLRARLATGITVRPHGDQGWTRTNPARSCTREHSTRIAGLRKRLDTSASSASGRCDETLETIWKELGSLPLMPRLRYITEESCYYRPIIVVQRGPARLLQAVTELNILRGEFETVEAIVRNRADFPALRRFSLRSPRFRVQKPRRNKHTGEELRRASVEEYCMSCRTLLSGIVSSASTARHPSSWTGFSGTILCSVRRAGAAQWTNISHQHCLGGNAACTRAWTVAQRAVDRCSLRVLQPHLHPSAQRGRHTRPRGPDPNARNPRAPFVKLRENEHGQAARSLWRRSWSQVSTCCTT